MQTSLQEMENARMTISALVTEAWRDRNEAESERDAEPLGSPEREAMALVADIARQEADDLIVAEALLLRRIQRRRAALRNEPVTLYPEPSRRPAVEDEVEDVPF